MPLTQADRVKVAVEMGVAQRVEVWLGDTHRQGDRQAVLEWEGQAEAEGEAVEEAEAEEEAVAEVVAVSEVEEVRGDSTSRRRSIRRRAAGGNALSRGLPRRTQGGARGRKEEGVVILGAGTRLAAVRRPKQIPERSWARVRGWLRCGGKSKSPSVRLGLVVLTLLPTTHSSGTQWSETDGVMDPMEAAAAWLAEKGAAAGPSSGRVGRRTGSRAGNSADRSEEQRLHDKELRDLVRAAFPPLSPLSSLAHARAPRARASSPSHSHGVPARSAWSSPA